MQNQQEHRKQAVRGRPFEKGRSGNPKGRPPGVRNRASLAAETLLAGEAEALTRKAVDLALGGDGAALKLCLERLVAPPRGRAVRVALPPLRDAVDVAPFLAAVTAAVGAGELTPGEAADLGHFVETWLRAVEAGEFERRLAAVEAGLASRA